MTLRSKLEALAVIALLATSAFIARSWLDAHDDQLRLRATIDAQQTVIAQAQQQTQQLAAAEKQRDAQTQATLASMQQASAKIQTPQQIVQWIPPQLATPAPITVNVPPSTAANPAPDAIATIPQQDLPVLRNEIESCKECTVKLAAAQQDLVTEDQQLKLAGAQLSATHRCK
jgi:alkanesulfonate monooxygenase SsuD/methylene tetrahydromethanopterin reductase-like flavin-dependent oxidoreductase (luciferase family)